MDFGGIETEDNANDYKIVKIFEYLYQIKIFIF